MKLLLILSLLSFNAFAGGAVGGASGTTGDDKVIVQPSRSSESNEDLDYGKNCLTSLDANFDFSGKDISSEFLKKEISNVLQKPKKSIGRSIASVEEDKPLSKPISCKIFARAIDDPRFMDLIVPRESLNPIEIPKPNPGAMTR